MHERNIPREAEASSAPDPATLAPLALPTPRHTNRRVEVKDRRTRTPKEKNSFIRDADPWEHSVDGDDLLALLMAAVGRYIRCSRESLLGIALWVLFTYTFPEAYISPILAITSPEKGCGKTNLLTILRWLAWRAVLASSFSAAVAYRIIDLWNPTLLMDEGDTYFHHRLELVGILNSGHTPGAAFAFRSAPNTLEPEQFSTWCPKAIAAIGNLPETIEHRSIRIRLRRALRTEVIAELREYRLDAEFEELRRKCARWALDHMMAVKHAEPEMPADLDWRPRDNWRPLIAIADLCGARWGVEARAAAIMLSGGMKDSTKSQRVEMLEDIRTILRGWESDRISSDDLVEALVAMTDRPWADFDHGRPLSQAKMARMLGQYSKPDGTPLKTSSIWYHGGTVRGYLVHDFSDAFARYLPEVQDPRGDGEDVDDAAD